MTTPAWLRQVSDLRTAIAADDLTVETALAQAADDVNLGLFHQDLIHTLLTYSDAEFTAFADYDGSDLAGSGKTDMGQRFMRAAMAAPCEYVFSQWSKGKGFRPLPDGTSVAELPERPFT